MVSQLNPYFLIYRNEKRTVSGKSIFREIIDNKMSKGLMKRRNMTITLLIACFVAPELAHRSWC